MDKAMYKELMKEFNTSVVEVREVAKKYYGLSAKAADQAASANRFNFATFKVGSQRSKWLARSSEVAKDLATKKGEIDAQRTNILN